MSNRETLINRLQSISLELQSELDYYLNDVDHEGPYDLADAFEDYSNHKEDRPGSFTNEVKRIYEDIGFVTKVDITKVITSSGGKKFWFKSQGRHMDGVSAWSTWLEK